MIRIENLVYINPSSDSFGLIPQMETELIGLSRIDSDHFLSNEIQNVFRIDW